MSLSIAEQERILETVHENLTAFIYNELSGIPEIRQRLQAQGLKLNIGLEAGIQIDSPAPETPCGCASDGEKDELEGWRSMGISLDDLRELAQTDTRRSAEALKAVMDEIREVSSSLSQRGRNYSWGWLHLHYPEIGLGRNPTTVKDERFTLLANSAYWLNIVETALRAISARPDKKEVLTSFLSTLKFAGENT